MARSISTENIALATEALLDGQGYYLFESVFDDDEIAALGVEVGLDIKPAAKSTGGRTGITRQRQPGCAVIGTALICDPQPQ